MEQTQRQAAVERTAILGIAVNLLIAALKIAVGGLSRSLAILSEGVNNAADAGSSFLTLAGSRLSAKHPDEKHPFGYGRIEYLTNLVIAVLILYTGLSLLRSAADAFLHPAEMTVSLLSVALVAVSAVCKLLLGLYTISVGRKTGSASLTAVGEEGRNDSVFSLITIGSTLFFLATGRSLDAPAGLVFAVVVLKLGIEILRDTVSELIGRPGEEELAKKLYKKIRRCPGVKNAADMMLHNYGPGRWSGSVNVEMNHSLTLGQAYEQLHELQLEIIHEDNVTMVFGLYAVDEETPESAEMRRNITAFIREHPHLRSYHALYCSRQSNTLYLDLVVDYDLTDWEALRAEFTAYITKLYPQWKPELVIETEYV